MSMKLEYDYSQENDIQEAEPTRGLEAEMGKVANFAIPKKSEKYPEDHVKDATNIGATASRNLSPREAAAMNVDDDFIDF